MTDHTRMEAARAIALTSGRSQEHLKFVIDYHERRTSELLAANTREVEERRSQTHRAEDAESQVAFLLTHNGVADLRAAEERHRVVFEQFEITCRNLDAANAEIEILKAQIAEAMSPQAQEDAA